MLKFTTNNWKKKLSDKKLQMMTMYRYHLCKKQQGTRQNALTHGGLNHDKYNEGRQERSQHQMWAPPEINSKIWYYFNPSLVKRFSTVLVRTNGIKTSKRRKTKQHRNLPNICGSNGCMIKFDCFFSCIFPIHRMICYGSTHVKVMGFIFRLIRFGIIESVDCFRSLTYVF